MENGPIADLFHSTLSKETDFSPVSFECMHTVTYPCQVEIFCSACFLFGFETNQSNP